MKHTPTPWAFGVYEATEAFRAMNQHSCICDPDTLALIATCGPAEDTQSQTDAEFICLAVNSHDRLTADRDALLAAQEADVFLQNLLERGSLYTSEICSVKDTLRAAIAQAESEGQANV